MADPIGVLVVEREPLLRRDLVGSLNADHRFKVLDGVATAEDGYRRADELLPHVVLAGTTLADAPGLTAATELRRRFPALATIVMTDREGDDELFGAIRAGAAAYLSTDVPEARLLEVVARTAGGEYVINEQLLAKPYVAGRVLEEFRAAAAGDLVRADAFAPLTDRELQILRGVSDGKTNARIGQELGISPQTVKNHVTSILRKLAVNDRTQAVVLALRRGWLPVDIPTLQKMEDVAGPATPAPAEAVPAAPEGTQAATENVGAGPNAVDVAVVDHDRGGTVADAESDAVADAGARVVVEVVAVDEEPDVDDSEDEGDAAKPARPRLLRRGERARRAG